MASFISDSMLNDMADGGVSSNLTARAHSASPGNSGTSSRIGTSTATLTASNWGNASGGDVTYNDDADFGVIDSGNNRTVTHISIWNAANTAFKFWVDMDSSVAVTAGGEFTVNTGTIELQGSSVSS